MQLLIDGDTAVYVRRGGGAEIFEQIRAVVVRFAVYGHGAVDKVFARCLVGGDRPLTDGIGRPIRRVHQVGKQQRAAVVARKRGVLQFARIYVVVTVAADGSFGIIGESRCVFRRGTVCGGTQHVGRALNIFDVRKADAAEIYVVLADVRAAVLSVRNREAVFSVRKIGVQITGNPAVGFPRNRLDDFSVPQQ